MLDVDLIKKLYKEGLNSTDIHHIIKGDIFYLRYKNSCYKTDKKNIDDINNLIITLKDCTDTYNAIEISDFYYVDGFVFPIELTDDNEGDEFICNLCTIDREKNTIVMNNRLGKKIPYPEFLDAINKLEKKYKESRK